MNRINKSIFLLLLGVAQLAFSQFSSASTQLCLKKEISSDGVNWFDANTEAEAVAITSSAFFKFTAFKCEGSFGGLYGINLTDVDLDINQPMDDLPSNESDFTPSIFTTEIPNYCGDYQGTIENVAHVEGYSMISHTVRNADDNAWAQCISPPQATEGCTPGYWKKRHHFDEWSLHPTTAFVDIFDREITVRMKRKGKVTNPTMRQAAKARGGKVNRAARHAVAAYLNATSDKVNYTFSADEVIAIFQSSFDNEDFGDPIEQLVDANQQGCPLN
ncbi:MAG: hypothetical protein OQK51_16095 [Kangiellaceae bacterium]|nr:hypothetical protein [Kangiellaceae bacterium]